MMRILLAVGFVLISEIIYAGCSPHMGLATINEVSKDHNWRDDDTDFIEIKKLDQQLSSSLMDTWTVEICDYFFLFFPSCSGPVSLSTLRKQGKYWILEGDPTPASYINWNFGFDITLKDENGDVVDYLSSNGVDLQEEACNYPFDTELSSGPSTRRAKRQPDGAGEWGVPRGNSEPETPGENNDAGTPPAGSPELSFVEDVQVSQGQDATFTIQLSTTSTSNVVINYETANGTGVEGTHYTATTGSVTINAGDLTATVDVPTIVSGESNTQTFYLLMTAATNATVADQIAVATITGYGGADHFTVSHSGSAANCETETIVLQAKDAAGNLLTTYTGSVSLATSTNHGDWSLIAGAGSFSTGASNSGAATIEFVSADSGEVQLGLSNTHAETISINVDDGAGITEASNNAMAADDPDLVFSASAFKFIYGTGAAPASEIIQNQTSAKPFSTDLGYEPLKLRAITTDINTGQCTGLFSGNTNIQLAMECVEPANCSSVANTNFMVAGDALPENNFGAVTTYTNKTLFFSANSTASLSANYFDAGRVRLHARYLQSGDSIMGGSQNIDVIPAGFCAQTASANSTCNGPNFESCTVFKKAGELFDLAVTAQGWVNNGDTDYCDNNLVLSSFNGAVDVAPSLVAPMGGNTGALSLTSINLLNGSASENITWSEVGVLALQMGGNAYLSTTLPANTSENFGRFTPFEFFITNHDDGTFSDAQSGFSYVGQTDLSGNGAIGYGTNPWIEFISRNANGDTIQNYLAGGFFNNPAGSYSVSSATLGADAATPLTSTAGFDTPAFSYDAATHTYRMTLSGNDHFRYDKNSNARIASFSNDLEIDLDDLTDDDGITASNSVTLSPTGGPVRYGRLHITNAYGPETENLDQTWQTQYFNGTDFVLNTLDSDTSINATSLVVGSVNITDSGDSSNPLQVGDSTLSGSQNVNSGQGVLTWSSPNGSRYGSFEFEYDAPDWLEYDWTGSGDEDPKGTVSFGRYRGHDKMIYWKEITY